MKFEREEEKEEEEEISNIRNKKWSYWLWKKRKKSFKERNINSDLAKKYFFTYDLGDVLKNFNKTNNNSKRNQIQVSMIKNRLIDLKEEITNTSQEEKQIKKPNEIVDTVENILEFNRQQQGHNLKILTLNQMLSRLPISLAQLKAGNNSEKLKSEIIQILYSLYRSKKLTKQLYKSLIDII